MTRNSEEKFLDPDLNLNPSHNVMTVTVAEILLKVEIFHENPSVTFSSDPANIIFTIIIDIFYVLCSW